MTTFRVQLADEEAVSVTVEGDPEISVTATDGQPVHADATNAGVGGKVFLSYI